MLVSSKWMEHAGSFAGLIQVGGTKESLQFKLSEEAYWVTLFEDRLALWCYGTRLFIQTSCVRAFGVDRIVKTDQIHISFVIDLNGWNPATVSEYCSYSVEIKSLKTE